MLVLILVLILTCNNQYHACMQIVRDAGDFLGRAVTIATRYTAVRRQTAPSPGERELQILDYDNVQQTLLPLVAQSYALKFMGSRMMAMYESFDAARDRNDFSSLPELHALSSGLKSLCTDLAAAGIETCRRTCGGHGYSVLSGLPTLFASYVQNVTWEGDNNVMYLQAARFLMKAVGSAAAGSGGAASATGGTSSGGANGRQGQTSSTAYLLRAREEATSRSRATCGSDWLSPEHVLPALRHVAARLMLLAAENLQKAAATAGVGGGKIVVEGAPWNETTVDLIVASKAHCRLVLHQTFVEEVEAAASASKLSLSTLRVLRSVVALHGVTMLAEAGGDLLEGGHVTSQHVAWLREQRRRLTRELRPNAVALVDSFGYEDYLLNSAIGRKDGDVYSALLAAARASPLNATDEGPAWKPVLEELLNPEIRSKL